jgi:hypothetical protein
MNIELLLKKELSKLKIKRKIINVFKWKVKCYWNTEGDENKEDVNTCCQLYPNVLKRQAVWTFNLSFNIFPLKMQ